MALLSDGYVLELTNADLNYEISQFLYDEAALLDERKFEDWFSILADDLHYFMPVRFNRMRREIDHEFSYANEVAHFDDDKANIWKRIRRLRTPQAWAEDPPSRTRHLVTNIRCFHIDGSSEILVKSCFHVYRSRLEHQVDNFVGAREDLLRPDDAGKGWHIVKRHLYLDQTIVLANNISFFF
jgi:3-phenylpropionate/cinnamic acid dioxygenase small subunit